MPRLIEITHLTKNFDVISITLIILYVNLFYLVKIH